MASPTKTLEKDIEALRRDVSALADSLSHMVSGASEATSAVRNGFDESINGAASAGRDFLNHAAKFRSHAPDAAREVANDATQHLTGEIKRNPLIAVVAAAAVGFLAGIAANR